MQRSRPGSAVKRAARRTARHTAGCAAFHTVRAQIRGLFHCSLPHDLLLFPGFFQIFIDLLVALCAGDGFTLADLFRQAFRCPVTDNGLFQSPPIYVNIYPCGQDQTSSGRQRGFHPSPGVSRLSSGKPLSYRLRTQAVRRLYRICLFFDLVEDLLFLPTHKDTPFLL